MIKLHNNLHNIPRDAKGCVIAIGNFDGVHLGHRALLKKAGEIAREKGAKLAVLTFEPHPREFFNAGGEPFRLALLPMKQRLLESIGVDHLFAAAFDRDFSQLSAADFIQKILVEALGAAQVVVGSDFGFGNRRTGDTRTLQTAAAQGLFGVTVLDTVSCPALQAYSSTRIRALLKEGQFVEASALLGWDWEIELPVVHGDKRGREMGFPTANQKAERYVRLPYGIYAVTALIEGEKAWRGGVANFGIRPMFRIEQPIFETYLFDFNAEIYGKAMRVRPLKYLRPEQAFKGIEALKIQIKQDCHEAVSVLKSQSQ